jgi:uncharacterized protein
MDEMKPLDESRVVEWLEANPDFFHGHPELLEAMSLPHGAGTASLIEVQVNRLRTENRQLKAQLQTLAGIAGENERLMQRLHQLTLEIMTTSDTCAFIEKLMQRLANDFKAGSVRLHLVAPHPELAGVEAVTIHDDSPPAWFEDVMRRGKIVFGRLTQSKLELLFPNRHEAIGSAALVPVNHSGLLAIGADSPGHFNPDMGTLFLELLGTTIRHRLELADDLGRKRA